MPRWLKGGLWSIAIAIAFVVLSGLGFALHADLPVGRRALADAITGALNDAMAGSASIGEIVSVDGGEVTVRELSFRDAAGKEILRFENAEVSIDLRALASRRIEIDRARVRGATVILEIGDDGEINIEEAFSAGQPDGGGKDLHLAFRSIHFEGVRFIADAGSGPTIVVEDAEGFIAIVRRPNEAVRVRFDRVSARVASPEPLGLGLHLERVDGMVRAKHPSHAVELRFEGTLGESSLRGTFDLHPDREEPAKLDLTMHDARLRSRLVMFGLRLIGRRSDDIEADVDVSRGS